MSGGSVRYLNRTLLKNVLHHTETHNRLLEERLMWKQKRTEDKIGGNEKEEREVFVDGRWQKKKRKRSRPSLKVSNVLSSSDDSKQELVDGEEIKRQKRNSTEDAERWGHSGFQQMYPDQFLSRLSMDEMSDEDEEPQSNPKKKSKKHKLQNGPTSPGPSRGSDGTFPSAVISLKEASSERESSKKMKAHKKSKKKKKSSTEKKEKSGKVISKKSSSGHELKHRKEGTSRKHKSSKKKKRLKQDRKERQKTSSKQKVLDKTKVKYEENISNSGTDEELQDKSSKEQMASSTTRKSSKRSDADSQSGEEKSKEVTVLRKQQVSEISNDDISDGDLESDGDGSLEKEDVSPESDSSFQTDSSSEEESAAKKMLHPEVIPSSSDGSESGGDSDVTSETLEGKDQTSESPKKSKTLSKARRLLHHEKLTKGEHSGTVYVGGKQNTQPCKVGFDLREKLNKRRLSEPLSPDPLCKLDSNDPSTSHNPLRNDTGFRFQRTFHGRDSPPFSIDNSRYKDNYGPSHDGGFHEDKDYRDEDYQSPLSRRLPTYHRHSIQCDDYRDGHYPGPSSEGPPRYHRQSPPHGEYFDFDHPGSPSGPPSKYQRPFSPFDECWKNDHHPTLGPPPTNFHRQPSPLRQGSGEAGSPPFDPHEMEPVPPIIGPTPSVTGSQPMMGPPSRMMEPLHPMSHHPEQPVSPPWYARIPFSEERVGLQRRKRQFNHFRGSKFRRKFPLGSRSDFKKHDSMEKEYIQKWKGSGNFVNFSGQAITKDGQILEGTLDPSQTNVDTIKSQAGDAESVQSELKQEYKEKWKGSGKFLTSDKEERALALDLELYEKQFEPVVIQKSKKSRQRERRRERMRLQTVAAEYKVKWKPSGQYANYDDLEDGELPELRAENQDGT